MSKGVLLVFSGPSGCGKGTVLKEFFAQGGSAFLSVSATTRQPRPGEENGIHYFFMSKEEFEKKLEQDEILEHACYCGNFYGTPRGPVYERLERGENVILEIEVQGALQIRKKCPEAVLVFVLPPSLSELRRRLVERKTEGEEAVSRRLEQAAGEIRTAQQYDYVIVNDSVQDAVEELNTILKSEKLKARNRINLIEEVLDYDA